MAEHNTISFSLNGMLFEYDKEKNEQNIKKHGISFKSAARVFFDYDRIEFYDEENSSEEDRYDTIGDTSAGRLLSEGAEGATIIGNVDQFSDDTNDILYVVYTERIKTMSNGTEIDDKAHFRKISNEL